jgi:hypothetical protein
MDCQVGFAGTILGLLVLMGSGRITARGWFGLFLLGAGLNILVGLPGWPGVFAGNLVDPDSYMRLERLLQGVAQGHLVNIVARDDAGAGVMVEWSRLLDLLLWVMAAPLAVFLGWRQALFAAGVALGPLGVGCLGLALAFAASRFSAAKYLWAAPVAAALLPGLQCFAAPGVVHYHILLLALIASTVGLTARAWNGDTGWAFLAGISGGFAIWLTPETMPFVLMAFAALCFRWTQSPIGAALAACGAGFFDVLGFALAIDPPSGGYGVAEIDRVSLVYVVLGLCLLLGGLALWRLQHWQNIRARRLIGIGLMAMLLLGWTWMFPQVAMGPYGVMDAADRQRFFGAMQELQPIRGASQLAEFLLPGLLALSYPILRAARGGPNFWLWLYVALCAAVALALGWKFILFVEFPAGLAAGLLPVMLTDASSRLRKNPAAAMLARLCLIFVMLLAPELPLLAAAKSPQRTAQLSACSLRHIAPMLAPYAGAIVLANANDTPELLYRSNILTVGSLYQHGVPAFLRLRAAWRTKDLASKPQAVTATGASYILFCTGESRDLTIADLPKDTLWDALKAQKPPAWLKLQASDPGSGWQLFQLE